MISQQSDIRSFIYLCSILDEKTKFQRSIVYDSPAATKKVFDVCHALEDRIKNVYVVTMARGKQIGNQKSFSATAKIISGLPVLSAGFTPLPILTYLVSSASLFLLIWRVIKQQEYGPQHLVVYNRNWLYVPSLILARLFRVKCYLDLEDGAAIETSGYVARAKYYLIKYAFGALCTHGSILVTPGLITQVSTSNNVVCYGVAKRPSGLMVNDWHERSIRLLFCGTLMRDAGALLLMDAVRILNGEFTALKGTITITITGHGPLADDLASFSQSEGKGWIVYEGRVAKSRYEELLSQAHVGMNLRLLSAEMGMTTFPSKVIEMAAQGKLVLTTKLGQVLDLLGNDGAFYVEDDTPITLAKAIVRASLDRDAAMMAAQTGQQRVLAVCSAENVADTLFNLFLGNCPDENR